MRWLRAIGHGTALAVVTFPLLLAGALLGVLVLASVPLHMP